MGTVLATFKSDSNPNRTYDVKLDSKTGKPYCTCPSWRFQRKAAEQRTCKHLDRFKVAFAKAA